MADKIIVCVDCGKEFTFTEGEQAFFAKMGYINEPKRCKECRTARNARKTGQVNQTQNNENNK